VCMNVILLGLHSYQRPVSAGLINVGNTEHTKLINGQQAKSTYAYKATKQKLHKTKAAIWFDKMPRLNHLTPRYIHITVSGNNQHHMSGRNMWVITI
jgi:hypothetical protein